MNKLFFLIGFAFLYSSCIKDSYDDPRYSSGYSEYKPVLIASDQLPNTVKAEAPITLSNPGKIYFKDNFIFINEKYKGIHVIDNSDSTNPKNVLFIRIPGCLDMAMREDVLYADHVTDMIAIQLNNTVNDIKVTKRIKNVFPKLLVPPDGKPLPKQYQSDSWPPNTICIEWVKIK